MSGHFLGPFQLVRPIAAGGMGQVWGAVHGRTPVAIKVLTGGAAWDPSYRSMFRNEVRAVAAMEHPHVVWLYDQGEVSHEAACQFWRANACADTLHAYGYWDGFLTILSERRTT